MSASQMTLLQIVQAVQAELGLPVASSVIGNSDLATTQILALANLEIDDLRQTPDDGWKSLIFEFNLTIPVPYLVTADVGLLGNLAQIDNITPALNTSIVTPFNWAVVGNAIPQAARVAQISADGTTVIMDMQATNAGAAQSLYFAQDTFPEPVGFMHFVNRTWWDRTNRWELLGPDSPQMDQWHRSGIVATGPRRHWRQVGPGITGQGNNWRIWPAPTEIQAPLQFAFEYIANTPVITGGALNLTQSNLTRSWTTDTDVSLLDDRAVIMGVKWRYWEQKGFNYISKQNQYVDYVDRLIARDGASPTLSIVKRVHPIFISPANVQDGFFPGPVGPSMG